MVFDLTSTGRACQEEAVVLTPLEERPTRDRAVEDMVPGAGLISTENARRVPREVPA